MALQVGQQIGSYRITAAIASGACGDVYQATHVILTSRVVALKLLHASFLESQQRIEAFYQEARFLEVLKHPYILPVLDVNTHEGYPYIVMEYAAHGSLRGVLNQRRQKPLTLSDTLHNLGQIGEALAFAHQHQIVHCDLKPENILFDGANQALLTDFGIAAVLHNQQMEAVEIGGTPAYMAPEQFQGKVHYESDQYALACIAYEMLTGQQPFISSDPTQLMQMHLHDKPAIPSHLNSALPPSVDQAVLKALSKQYNRRYPDVTSFISAMRPQQQQVDYSAYLPTYNKPGPKLILREGHRARQASSDEIHDEATLSGVDAQELAKAAKEYAARKPSTTAKPATTKSRATTGTRTTKKTPGTAKTTRKSVDGSPTKPVKKTTIARAIKPEAEKSPTAKKSTAVRKNASSTGSASAAKPARKPATRSKVTGTTTAKKPTARKSPPR